MSSVKIPIFFFLSKSSKKIAAAAWEVSEISILKNWLIISKGKSSLTFILSIPFLKKKSFLYKIKPSSEEIFIAIFSFFRSPNLSITNSIESSDILYLLMDFLRKHCW